MLLEHVVIATNRKYRETFEKIKKIQDPEKRAKKLLILAQHEEGALSASLHARDKETAKTPMASLFEIGEELLKTRDAEAFAAYLQGPLRNAFEKMESYLLTAPAPIAQQMVYIIREQQQKFENLLERIKEVGPVNEEMLRELEHVLLTWAAIAQRRAEYFSEFVRILDKHTRSLRLKLRIQKEGKKEPKFYYGVKA